jgi:hypothetical protein
MAGAHELSGRGRTLARVRFESGCRPAPGGAHPNAESDSRPNSVPAVAPGPQPAAAVGQRRYAVHPIAGSGCRRLIPAATAVAAGPSGVRHAVLAEGRAPGPGLPVRRSSFHWSCPNGRANAALSVPRRPGRPRVSARLRWSEVWQSYSSPEQQFCHRTPHTFLEKSQSRSRILPPGCPRRASPPADASYTGL